MNVDATVLRCIDIGITLFRCCTLTGNYAVQPTKARINLCIPTGIDTGRSEALLFAKRMLLAKTPVKRHEWSLIGIFNGCTQHKARSHLQRVFHKFELRHKNPLCWHMQPAKYLISLRRCDGWSKSSLSARDFYVASISRSGNQDNRFLMRAGSY